jgi:hypothetical protein
VNLFGWNDVNHSTTLTGSKLNSSVNHSEQRVVATTANILASMERGSALTDQNGASGDGSTTEAFHAEALCV